MLTQKQSELIAFAGYISKYPIYLFENGVLLSNAFPISKAVEEQWVNPFSYDPALLQQLTDDYRENHSEIIRENEQIHYGIKQITSDILCVLGPIASMNIQKNEIREYYHRHHIRNTADFCLQKASTNRTLSLLAIIQYCLTGEYTSPPIFDTLSRSTPFVDFPLLKYQMQNSESDIRHIPYIVEKRIANAISHGNLNDLKELLQYNAEDYSLGTLANTSRKQLEYQAVVSISLFSRAAIEGGVDPYSAYDQNDLFLQKLSVAATEREYQSIVVEALLKYCGMVKIAQEGESPSMHITKCKHYISTHLNKSYKMQDLADYVGISPKYLGDLFSKTEGQTLKSYILQTRIEAAKNMLKYSDYSISQIASYLCFDTQSHFGMTFRKFEGTSPSEYRKHNHPVNF